MYNMWILTYLTDVCEKLFQGSCYEEGLSSFNINSLFKKIDSFDTDSMCILILGK